METSLGRGYLLNEEFGITDFYSPPSSIIDEYDEYDDDLFYPEDEIEENLPTLVTNNTILSSSSINEINLNEFKSSTSFKLMPIESTPPPTPLLPRRLLEPINSTTIAFQNLTINTNLPIKTDPTSKNWSLGTSTTEIRTFPHPSDNPTKLLTPTSIDRYFTGHRHLSDSTYRSSTTLDLPLAISSLSNRHQSISVQHTEVTNETSRLYSYMTPIDRLPTNIRTPCYDTSQSRNNNSYVSQQNFKPPCINPMFSNSNGPFSHSPTFQQQQQQQQYQSHDTWILSEMSAILRQQQQQQQQQQQPMTNFNTNISLSRTAQQILAANTINNNNRPLRSEKIDIDVIRQLIQESKWKQQCGMKKEVCVFCRNNGENELIFSSHSLKDSIGNVTCPILRSYQCPICGATGAQAHTIKYCQATGNDNNRHVPTPYEKMIHMQTFGFDDNMIASIPSVFGQMASPSSLYTNGWSNSYL